MNIRKYVILGVAVVACSWSATMNAADQWARFHNEQSDTSRINSIIIDAMTITPAGARTAAIGEKFINTPYVAHTLEWYDETGDHETVTVNLDQLDCTTFVETVMALSMTAAERRGTWREFVNNLRSIRYRSGEVNGYPSRLHYISDWTVDNVHRGNFVEVTGRMPATRYLVRSIDFMTGHRDRYPALADSANYERMRAVESGYRNHRFAYIPTPDLGRKEVKAALQAGDIVALVTKMKDLDVTHMGIIVKRDGVPYLLHASSSNGKVEVSSMPLDAFMKKNPSLMGIRVYRLTE